MEREKMSLKAALILHLRALKDIQGLDPYYLPALVLEKVVAGLSPFVLIYLSASLLNELAGLRRPAILWKWVGLTVALTGLLALIKVVLASWTELHEDQYYQKRQSLFVNKYFDMDFADLDKQATYDLHSQINQYENWMGWGYGQVPYLLAQIVEASVGILSALVLTSGLFLAQVPSTSSSYLLLNHPLFLIGLVALMILLSGLSGRLHAYANKLETDLADQARFGNRIFSYFVNFFGEKRDVDIRIYKQDTIAQHYLIHDLREGFFGVKGPFARLAKGKGGITHSLAASLSVFFTGTIYLFTSLKALAGAFGVGTITQYVGSATALSQHLTQLFTSLGAVQTNGNFLDLTYQFLDIPNKMYQGALTTEKRNDRQYQIEFRDVSFQYPGTDTWALHHINVAFTIGNRIAIVGENGSGKTTFIKLLCRLYDPQEGQILLNGIDIRKYNYREYMDIFAVVFQDFQLLSQPLADNVAGKEAYDPEQVSKVLFDAGFGDRLASLPKGLKTQIYRDYGPEGVEVSGGEAQKIAIARGLYRDAPFLILDEPTAALDPIAEAEIYQQLGTIVDDRTAIYISHRLSSCRFCDEILVFDQGQIIQEGSHEELVSDEDGKYYALWNAQAQYYSQEA